MELFTKVVDTRDLIMIIREKLRIDKVSTTVFDNIPSMNWIDLQYEGLKFTIHHHIIVKRYGFEGSLISINQIGYKGTDMERATHEKLLRKFATSLGGIMEFFGSNENLEGVEAPGTENSEFILRELLLSGESDEEISDLLEKYRQKRELIKKSN